MLPKEKAIDLVRDFVILDDKEYKNIDWKDAKRCAIITVNEILHILFQHHKIDYWKEVKAEIERL